MASPLAEEKRQRKRFQKSCNIEFFINNETHRGISDNFSVNGLLIMTDNLPALYSVVSITVHLPGGEISNLKGRVRRHHKVSSDSATGKAEKISRSGMGVEIIERDANYLMFIMSLLSKVKM